MSGNALKPANAGADGDDMRQLIIGAGVLIWGLAIIVNHFILADEPAGASGAYEAGGNGAVVFAAVMVAAGGFTLFKAAAAKRES